MDTLPLPPRPHVDQYRKRAKELVAAASADPSAVHQWAHEWLSTLARLLGVTELTPFVQQSFDRAVAEIERRVSEKTSSAKGKLALADAQHLIAVAHGFPNWG